MLWCGGNRGARWPSLINSITSSSNRSSSSNGIKEENGDGKDDEERKALKGKVGVVIYRPTFGYLAALEKQAMAQIEGFTAQDIGCVLSGFGQFDYYRMSGWLYKAFEGRMEELVSEFSCDSLLQVLQALNSISYHQPSLHVLRALESRAIEEDCVCDFDGKKIARFCNALEPLLQRFDQQLQPCVPAVLTAHYHQTTSK